MVFSWNSWNVGHIAKHSVSTDEAEYIVRSARPPFPRAIGDGKHMVWGRTDDGRLLQVVFVLPADEAMDLTSLRPADRLEFQAGETVIYVIHSMELTPDQKRQFRKMRG